MERDLKWSLSYIITVHRAILERKQSDFYYETAFNFLMVS
ncbi:hypothetical protein MTsPCn5_13240 [Croceitalea sp. MTPC5]|nr:hypothetical protein MTsPCn5_13240 [Croceitalea sp. MTPC5]